MASGNVTFAQTLGLMTGMTTVTRSAATSATALNRIQSRYNQIIDESSSTGKKLSDWYSQHGIEVKNEEGDLISLYEVLREVNKQWGELSQSDKDYYQLIQAGATQKNRLAALINNYEDVANATKAAENANGSATEEFTKTQESLAYALRDLNSAWEKLSQDLVSSGTLTKFVNLATKVVDILDNMVNTVGGMPTLFLSVAASISAVSGALKLLELPGKGVTKLFEKIGLGGASVAETATTVAGAGAAVEGAEAAGLGATLMAGWKSRKYNADPSILEAMQNYTELNDAEKKVIEQSKLLTAAKEAESKATDNLNKKNFSASMAYHQAVKSESGTMDDALKKRKRLANANEKVKVAEQELANATANVATQEAALKKAQADAAKEAGKLTPAMTAVTGALVGTAAAIAVIAGLNWVGKKIEENFGFEGTTKKVKKYNDELEETNDKIDKLLDGRNYNDLTDAEKEELEILKAERDVLEEQVELYKERRKKAARNVLTSDHSMQADASQVTGGVNYAASIGTITDAKTELQALIKEKGIIEDQMRSVEKGSTEWKMYKEALSDVNREIVAQRDKIDDLEKKSDEYRSEAISDWKDMRNEYGDVYKYMNDENKALYDNTHKYALLARDDIDDEVAGAAADMIDLFGSNTFGKMFSDSDLANFKDADEMLEAMKEKLAKISDDTEIKLYTRDEAGNILDEIKIKKGELTDEQWDIVLNAAKNGDWTEFDKLTAQFEGKEGKEELYNFLVNFKAQNEDGTNSFFTDEQLNPKVKVTLADKKAEDKWKAWKRKKNLNKTVSVTAVKANPDSVLWKLFGGGAAATGGKDGTTLSATGKRKGEKGGLSWLGDEGSVQNPRPELVKSDDGAFLAGLGGWELVNLKSSDTVYTATQTKKLLANNSFKGSAGELPRYAKGKFAKSDSKASKKSDTKMENWEYQLDIGEITEAEYISNLQKLAKQTKKITKDQYRDIIKTIYEYNQEKEEAVIDEYLTQVEYGKMTYDELVTYLNADKKINDETRQDLLKSAEEAEETRLENLAEEYATQVKYGKMSYQDFVDFINSSDKLSFETREKLMEDAQEAEAEWLQTQLELGMIDFDTYYDGIQSLDKISDKEDIVTEGIESMIDAIEDGGGAWGDFESAGSAALEAIQKGANDSSLGISNIVSLLKSYQSSMLSAAKDKYQTLLDEEELYQELYETVAQRNIDALQDQIDKIEEENEAQETQNELLEAEAALVEAKSKKIRVWQAGVGWTYKEDTKAVKEAQESLNEIKKDSQTQVLQDAIDEWQEYLETIQDEYAYDLLLTKLGLTDTEVQALTGDSMYLTEQFKNNYSQVLSNINAYESELDQIDRTKGKYAELASMVTRLIALYIQLAQAKAEADMLSSIGNNLASAKAATATATSATEAAQSVLDAIGTRTKKNATTYDTAESNVTAAQNAQSEAQSQENAIQAQYDAAYNAFVTKYGSSPTEFISGLNSEISSITSSLNNSQYASGTTSATGGWSLVGENGPEIRMLNKGDAIFSNAASRNLMALSQYTPSELVGMASDSHNSILNVQKGAIVINSPTGNSVEIAQEIVTQLERKSTQMSYRRVI